jgi:5-formyltetrahydrofolate cyclo-ligase
MSKKHDDVRDDTSSQKQFIRQLVLSQRLSLTEAERTEKSKQICLNTMKLPEFSADSLASRKVSLFQSYKSEVELEFLVKHIAKNQGRCYFPVMVHEKIIMAEYYIEKGNTQLKMNSMGIFEPKQYSLTFTPMHIVLVPGIAFDIKGNRIGYGRGFYDRYLAQYAQNEWPLLVSPVYDFQVRSIIPSTQHDIPVDIIVTEKRIITINR